MRKPENWTLTKVKKMKNGGIEGSFSNTKMEKGITNAEEWNFKNTENPHPDLTERMDQLKVYLTKCYGMDSVVILSNSKGLTAGDPTYTIEVSNDNLTWFEYNNLSTDVSVNDAVDDNHLAWIYMRVVYDAKTETTGTVEFELTQKQEA